MPPGGHDPPTIMVKITSSMIPVAGVVAGTGVAAGWTKVPQHAPGGRELGVDHGKSGLGGADVADEVSVARGVDVVRLMRGDRMQVGSGWGAGEWGPWMGRQGGLEDGGAVVG